MAPFDGIGIGLSAFASRARGDDARGDAAGGPASTAGQRPAGGDTAAALRRHLQPAFNQTYERTISSVVKDAISGSFEDPALSAEADLLRQRLLAGRQALEGAAGIGRGRPPAAAADGTGAAAAPEERAATVGGGGADAALAADERRLLEVHSQQAHQRVAKVSSSLRARFSAGNALPSAASGRLDFRNFRPTNEEEAKAFAERLAIDMTEGTAQLEAIATDLDLARHDHAVTGFTTSAQRVAELERSFERQHAFVLELADVVNNVSGDAVDEVRPGADGAGMGHVIAEAVRDGATPQEIERLRKLHTIVSDEAATGNSQLVNDLQQDMLHVLNDIWRRQDDAAEKRRRAEAERRQDYRRADERAAERRAEQERSDAIAAQRRAEFERLYSSRR